MNKREAGRRGGGSKSRAKCAASRKNGAKGGRPSSAELLLRAMRALYERFKPLEASIDPHDLLLIIERMCRKPGSGRRFFIRPLPRGGYVV